MDLLADGDVWLCFVVLRQRLQQVDYDQIYRLQLDEVEVDYESSHSW